MSSLKSKILAALLINVGLAVCFGPVVQAEKGAQAVIDIPASLTPARAVGLVLTNNGTTQVEKAKFVNNGKGIITVTFPYSLAKVKGEAYASAMVQSESGDYAFGPVRRLGVPGSEISLMGRPNCSPPPVNPGLASHIALLEQLVTKRSDRRVNRETVLKDQLSGELLKKLQRYEKGFGFNYKNELSPTLNPVELSFRLDRILDTLKLLKLRREQNQTNNPDSVLEANSVR